MEKSIVAKCYPTRIILFTRLGDIHGSTWTESNCLTILPVNIPNAVLGTVALRHLMLSALNELTIDERWDLRDSIKQLTKFKTEGQAMKDCKFTSVYLTDKSIRFEPKENRYSEVRNRSYAFYGMPGATFKIKYPCSPEKIGASIRKAWDAALIT